MQRSALIKSAARIALLAVSIATLGACASIPQRAWANGRAMTGSQAYRAVMNGDMSFQTHHQLQYSLNPLKTNYQDLPYQPFAQTWWY